MLHHLGCQLGHQLGYHLEHHHKHFATFVDLQNVLDDKFKLSRGMDTTDVRMLPTYTQCTACSCAIFYFDVSALF